jgi:cytochrome bd-type quinol oxidase subunit 2
VGVAVISLHPESPRHCRSLWIGLLILLVAVEVASYYEIATRANDVVGKRTDPDSSMGYFRDHYFVPMALLFIVVSILVLGWASRRGHGRLHLALGLLLALNVIMVVGSAIWYFRTIDAAASATSPRPPP